MDKSAISQELDKLLAQQARLQEELAAVKTAIEATENKLYTHLPADAHALDVIGKYVKSIGTSVCSVTEAAWFEKQRFAVRNIQIACVLDNVSMGCLTYTTDDGWTARLLWDTMNETGSLVAWRSDTKERNEFPKDELETIASWQKCNDFAERVNAVSSGWRLALLCARCDFMFLRLAQ